MIARVVSRIFSEDFLSEIFLYVIAQLGIAFLSFVFLYIIICRLIILLFSFEACYKLPVWSTKGYIYLNVRALKMAFLNPV